MPTSTLVLDSITHLTAADRGRVVLAASHGGSYVGYFAAKHGVAAMIVNDAGIGREQAGLGGVRMFEALGLPAAAVSHRTARIGDGADCARRGLLSFVNRPAEAIGLRVGMAASEAMTLLAARDLAASPAPPVSDEHLVDITDAGRGDIRVIAMDSASLVAAEHTGHIVVTASHGALLNGKPESAVKYPVFAMICNDADRGIDEAGISRLPALDLRGIAAACVSAFSARIGDGLSTYRDGYISALNATAERHGGRIGQSCRDFVAAMVAARGRAT